MKLECCLCITVINIGMLVTCMHAAIYATVICIMCKCMIQVELSYDNWSPLKSVPLDRPRQKNWSPRTVHGGIIGPPGTTYGTSDGPPLAADDPPSKSHGENFLGVESSGYT